MFHGTIAIVPLSGGTIAIVPLEFFFRGNVRKNRKKYSVSCIVPILYCSNHFFQSSIAFFLGFLGSKSDSRNHFHFSACGLEVEKCFLNHFLNLENLGKMQFQTRKNCSRSELEQYTKQNTISAPRHQFFQSLIGRGVKILEK